MRGCVASDCMKTCWSIISIACLVTACATAGTAEPKTDDPMTLRPQDAASTKQRERTLSDELATMKKRYAELESKFATAQAALDKAAAEKAELQEQVDANAELSDTMKQQIADLTEARDKLTKQLAEITTGLGELRKQKAAVEVSAATYREVVDKLRSMSEAGQLQIATRDGRMILALSNDILFDSGRTNIKQRGQAALAKIAQVLTSVANRKFLIAGHTDNVPIRSRQFSSNWELSTRRAVEVVHYLVSQHMSPQVLAAAGYGEFNPIVPNDTADHRALNRRIEIVLLPSVLELPTIDNVTTPSDQP